MPRSACVRVGIVENSYIPGVGLRVFVKRFMKNQ